MFVAHLVAPILPQVEQVHRHLDDRGGQYNDLRKALVELRKTLEQEVKKVEARSAERDQELKAAVVMFAFE